MKSIVRCVSFVFLFMVSTSAFSQKKLILCVDGLSYRVIEQMQELGYFSMFTHPSRLIAPFPSLTAPGIADLFKEGPVNGYQEGYFDIQKNRSIGGPFGYYFWGEYNVPFAPFDYKTSIFKFPLKEHLSPVTFAKQELADFVKIYNIGEKDKFIAYLSASDALLHRKVYGRFEYLDALNDVLASLQEREPTLEIIVISDHGHSLQFSQRIELGYHMAKRGYQIHDRIRSVESVVIPTLGFVSSVSIYTMEENEWHIAKSVSRLEGVDLAMYEQDGRVTLFSGEGEEGIIEQKLKDGETWYRYLTPEGDPLYYLPLVETLRSQNLLDQNDFALAASWFWVSKDHIFPDALDRIMAGMTSLVRNPANVMLSLSPGYFWGHAAGGSIIDVESTHGSLHYMDSVGIFMSTKRRLKTHLRNRDIADLIRPEATESEE